MDSKSTLHLDHFQTDQKNLFLIFFKYADRSIFIGEITCFQQQKSHFSKHSLQYMSFFGKANTFSLTVKISHLYLEESEEFEFIFWWISLK